MSYHHLLLPPSDPGTSPAGPFSVSASFLSVFGDAVCESAVSLQVVLILY